MAKKSAKVAAAAAEQIQVVNPELAAACAATPEQAEPIRQASASVTAQAAADAPQSAKALVLTARYYANSQRWYVYLRGVAPMDNIGCGCKSATSALKFMYMKRRQLGASIDPEIYKVLSDCAHKEAQLIKKEEYINA
jgi:cell division septation protein DedD